MIIEVAIKSVATKISDSRKLCWTEAKVEKLFKIIRTCRSMCVTVTSDREI